MVTTPHEPFHKSISNVSRSISTCHMYTIVDCRSTTLISSPGANTFPTNITMERILFFFLLTRSHVMFAFIPYIQHSAYNNIEHISCSETTDIPGRTNCQLRYLRNHSRQRTSSTQQSRREAKPKFGVTNENENKKNHCTIRTWVTNTF